MIKVKDSTGFDRLLKALADEIVVAHIHYQLYKDLRQALSEHPLVVAQSRVFWQLSLNAHSSTSMQALCRVYDQSADALHLHSWLLTIRKHLHLFDQEAFRLRLKDNPYLESLAQLPRKPDQRVLDEDIKLCLRKDPLVETLVNHRNSHVAHMDATKMLAAHDPYDARPLNSGNFEALLARAKTIFNRYNRLWAANTYDTQIIGHDDYQFIFECVEEKIEENRPARSRKRDQP